MNFNPVVMQITFAFPKLSIQLVPCLVLVHGAYKLKIRSMQPLVKSESDVEGQLGDQKNEVSTELDTSSSCAECSADCKFSAAGLAQTSHANSANTEPKRARDLSRDPMFSMDAFAARVFDAALLRHFFASWHRTTMASVTEELEDRLEGQNRICDFLSAATLGTNTQAFMAPHSAILTSGGIQSAARDDWTAKFVSLQAEYDRLQSEEAKARSLQANYDCLKVSAAASAALVTTLCAELGELRKGHPGRSAKDAHDNVQAELELSASQAGHSVCDLEERLCLAREMLSDATQAQVGAY